MTKGELFKMVEDEVAAIVQTPLREPAQQRNPKYRPVLQNEDDIDDMVFYTGNPPDEVKEKRQKKSKSKKLLSFGNK